MHIFFATDRAPDTHKADIQYFSGGRASGETLTFGSAEISIPQTHKMGVLERPSIFRLRLRVDPGKDVALVSATVLQPDEFHKLLSRQLTRDSKREALVFVHGYNVTFEDAAVRLGQITYDLGFQGAPILYSWPSSGNPLGYLADEESAEWSTEHFVRFLKMLREDQDIRTIYVIGHSMGNRLITAAFTSLQRIWPLPFRIAFTNIPDSETATLRFMSSKIMSVSRLPPSTRACLATPTQSTVHRSWLTSSI